MTAFSELKHMTQKGEAENRKDGATNSIFKANSSQYENMSKV